MSEWKEEAAQRRDARNIKSPEAAKPVPAKKDKKRWCRGKVGVEHQPVCRNYVDIKGAADYAKAWKLLVCTECGKELDRYMPFFRFGKAKEPPAWVV